MISKFNLQKNGVESLYNFLKNYNKKFESVIDLIIASHSIIGYYINNAIDGPSSNDIYRLKTMKYIIENSNAIIGNLLNPNEELFNDDIYNMAVKIFDSQRNIYNSNNTIVPDSTFKNRLKQKSYEKTLNDSLDWMSSHKDRTFTYTPIIKSKTNINSAIFEYLRIVLAQKDASFRNKFRKKELNSQETAEIIDDFISSLKVEYSHSYEQDIKEGYVTQLTNIINALEINGILEENNTLNSKRFNNIGLDFLSFNYDTNNKDKKADFSITELR